MKLINLKDKENFEIIEYRIESGIVLLRSSIF